MDPTDRRTRALIACSGLEHAGRGFETLARELFDALRDDDTLDVRLAKGSGRRADRELVARTLTRDGAPARAVARVGRTTPYDVEQLAFTAMVLPAIARFRPQVVFMSDLLVSRALARWRRRFGAPFSLVVSNGGPWAPDLLHHADHIQQLTPAALEFTLDHGGGADRNTLLPLAVAMPAQLDRLSDNQRTHLRRSLVLPESERIVLSVGVLDPAVKRVDYLIREIASLPAPRPFLVLLGDEERGVDVRGMAASLLGDDGFLIRTVPRSRISDYYRAADVFALASFVEAFGLVMVEAASYGLPCVVHDGPVQRYVLGPHGVFGDLAHGGELARLLAREHDASPRAAAERHRYVHERFSWDALAPRYAQLVRSCANRAG